MINKMTTKIVKCVNINRQAMDRAIKHYLVDYLDITDDLKDIDIVGFNGCVREEGFDMCTSFKILWSEEV